MKIMFHIRESLAYAYLQGLYETLRWGNGSGRTHGTNILWTEAYEIGMNHADWLRGYKEPT